MKLGNILKQHWAFTVSETRRKLYFFSVNYDCLQYKLEYKLNEMLLYVFTAYLVTFQEILMDFISYRILHLSSQ